MATIIGTLGIGTVFDNGGLRQGLSMAANLITKGVGQIGATAQAGLGTVGGIFTGVGSAAFGAVGGLAKFTAQMTTAAGVGNALGVGSIAGLLSSLAMFGGPIGAFGAAIGGALTGIAQLANAGFSALNSQGKLQKQFGLSAQAAAGFRVAFGRLGVDIDEVQVPLARFQQLLGEASGGSDQAIHKLESLGLGFSAAELAAMPFDRVLGLVADRFKGLTSANERATLAHEIFGRNWHGLAPLLNQGAAGFEAAATAASNLGLVHTEAEIQAAKEAMKDWKAATFDLGATFENLSTNLATGVTPFVRDLTTALRGVSEVVADVNRAVQGVRGPTFVGPDPNSAVEIARRFRLALGETVMNAPPIEPPARLFELRHLSAFGGLSGVGSADVFQNALARQDAPALGSQAGAFDPAAIHEVLRGSQNLEQTLGNINFLQEIIDNRMVDASGAMLGQLSIAAQLLEERRGEVEHMQELIRWNEALLAEEQEQGLAWSRLNADIGQATREAQRQAQAIGMTKTEAELLKFQLRGATTEQLATLDATLRWNDAMQRGNELAKRFQTPFETITSDINQLFQDFNAGASDAALDLANAFGVSIREAMDFLGEEGTMSLETFGAGLMEQMEKAEKALGTGGGPKALMAGSADALNAINRLNGQPTGNPQERMVQLLEQLAAQNEAAQEARRELAQAILDNPEDVLEYVPPNGSR